MIHTYDDAVQYLESKKEAGIRYDLDRIKRLMEALRHPERKVKTIHVAGTNGKGSTVTYLRSMLAEANFFVGTFMTPVFGEIQEQIAINGEPMSREDFTNVINEILPVVKDVEEELGEMISEFELMTTLALYYFSFKKPVDMAIIETGMGGREDATNVIVPLVSIITNVGTDHQAFLGDSITEIASHKAGIIKPGVPVMTAATGDALQVIQEEGKKLHASVYTIGEKCSYSTSYQDGKQFLNYKGLYRHLEEVPLGMIGDHQGINAALAIMTLDYLKQYLALMVDDDEVIRGAGRAFLPGRYEQVSAGNIILDTAHNLESIETLIGTIETQYADKKINVLFAVMKDKNVKGMLDRLHKSSVVENISVTTFPSERALPLNEFTLIDKNITINETKDPVHYVQSWMTSEKEKILIVTGSHEFIKFVKNEIN